MVKSAMLFLDQSKYAQVPNLEIIPTRSEILAGLIENKDNAMLSKGRGTHFSELFYDAINLCSNWN